MLLASEHGAGYYLRDTNVRHLHISANLPQIWLSLLQNEHVHRTRSICGSSFGPTSIPADINTHKVPIYVPPMKIALRGANVEELGFPQWRTGENDGIL
jgi:hypothetical protein